ncbi:hypothetical protein PV327_000519 [Microctonus hyperodae]|uniref:Uncharacterized protein n=1 Tax=Microctonus hyperodae TaxID=165561 RepID=A0AA39G6D3_MICHY|nr:hypothetical protein PV327_000519 [Microctonus hyperodae]
MQSLWFITCVHLIFILHNTSIQAMSPPVHHPFKDGASQIFRQQAQFGEGVRDWFVDMKDRIFDNLRPPELSTIFTQAKDEYEHQKKMVENFWLDLMHIIADVSFDPDRDWGFHLGSWYIIKKSDHSNTNKANLPDIEIKIEDPTTTTTTTTERIHHEDSEEVESLDESTTPTIVTLFEHETTTYIIEENTTFETNANEIENVDEKNIETYGHFTSDH